MELEQYSKQHPDEKLDCPRKHPTAIDRGCNECGYGIWTDCIKCPHCGSDNYCAECEPDEFDEERSQRFWD